MGVLSNMKRLLYLIILTSVLFSLSGCQKSITQLNESTNKNKLKVVTTIFPQYDFVRQVAGDNVELTMLSHRVQKTVIPLIHHQRIFITIQNCDVFIYVGGGIRDMGRQDSKFNGYLKYDHYFFNGFC